MLVSLKLANFLSKESFMQFGPIWRGGKQDEQNLLSSSIISSLDLC
jgi:O-acetyl-ADP-ribose deacetylase (regulator of RNase III)